MSLNRSFAALMAAVALLACQATAAHAQLTRTFVSAAVGNDANDCSQATPCRSFQGAHDKTSPNGEITVLDPGGYGAVTIAKSISIVNDGVGEAGILVSAGGVGIVVNAGQADYVNLRGITIQGIGFGGSTGVQFLSAFAFTLSDCVIRNNVGEGLFLEPSTNSHLSISKTLITDNGGAGIHIAPAGAGNPEFDLNEVEAYHNSVHGLLIDTSHINKTVNGTFLGSVNVAVTDSLFGNNAQGGLATNDNPAVTPPGSVIVTRSLFANNKFGFVIGSSSIPVLVGGSIVAGNSTAAVGGTAAAVNTFRDNYSIANNGSDGLGFTNFLK